MKKYIYLEKEDGLLIAHHITATNRQEVKEKTGVCIDNIYSKDLIKKVGNWLSKKMYRLMCDDCKNVIVCYGNRLYYIDSFVEFRNIVAEYRER